MTDKTLSATPNLGQTQIDSRTKLSSLKPEKERSSPAILLILLHIGLGLALRESELLSTLHALFVLALSIWIALTAKDLVKVLPYVAYVVGSEVLWRMTKADIFWEFSKYALVLILVIALMRHRKVQGVFLPVLFFVLLVPSILLTINSFGFSETTREAISFNLSGALTLSVCAVTFSNVRLSFSEIKKMIWAMVYPISAIFAIALISTLTSEAITFTPDSNFVTSGGYGPNQVSAILGLGALLLGMLLLISRQKGFYLTPIVLAIAFLAQSILTFSRGGIVNVAVSVLAVITQLILKPERSSRRVLLFLVIIVIVTFVVAPRLDTFTAGALSERYSDFDTTGRTELIEADLDLFKNNQLAGVGVGMSAYLRRYMPGAAAHTEYSRLLAEHGMFGLVAILLLVLMFIRAWVKAPDTISKALVLALSAWVFVEMSHAAMRVASIGYVFGWALTEFQVDGDSADTTENETRNHKGLGRVAPGLFALRKSRLKKQI